MNLELLKTIVTIVFAIISVIITVIILMQQGKDVGLGSLGGQAQISDSYWSKNKGRSKEGVLIKVTTLLIVLYFILAAVLNIGSF